MKQFKPGDEVMGDLSTYGFGAFAEYACCPENLLARKPARMSFEEAADMPQAGVLALQGLRQFGKITPATKILINGAGGGVGTFALQLAKNDGAEVTVVDKANKLEPLQAMGADHVLDYKKTDFTKTGSQYHLIMDVCADHALADYKRALMPNGKCVIIGGGRDAL